MITMIDTTQNTTPWHAKLAEIGITDISRYFTRLPGHDQYKVIHRAEAESAAAHGLRIFANYEGAGATPDTFSYNSGLADARFARQYGFHELSMPEDAAIYFSSEAQFDSIFIAENLIPYFRGVKQAMNEPSNLPAYKIGCYSSGSVLTALFAHGLIDYDWLPNALGWGGSRQYLASGRWHLRQLPTVNGFLPGLNVDPSMRNPNYAGPIGDFGMDGVTIKPKPVAPPAPAQASFPMIQNGDTGPAVVMLQNFLGIPADGIFGDGTEAAVEAFQKAHALDDDGIVGVGTWSVLQAMAQGV